MSAAFLCYHRYTAIGRVSSVDERLVKEDGRAGQTTPSSFFSFFVLSSPYHRQSYVVETSISLPPTLVSSNAPKTHSDAFCASESPITSVIFSRS